MEPINHAAEEFRLTVVHFANPCRALQSAAIVLTVAMIAGCGARPNPETTEVTEPSAPAQEASSEEADGKIEESDLQVPATRADISDDDLFPNDAVAGDASTSAQPELKVLDDSFVIEEKYDNGSTKRKWHVRLFVNFDRGKPWHQQAPGSWQEHGLYEEYYPGTDGEIGQIFVSGEFDSGLREGTWTYWHPNGQKAKEGEYRAAKLEGPWNIYDEQGALLRTEQYADGRRAE